MKASALLIVISILLPNLITGEPIDPDAKLAEWDGGFVTVADYREWWQRMDPKERPALRTIDEKRDYLDKIIDVRLMLAGAESLALDTLPKIRMWLEKQRISALKKALEDEAITADIRIDPLEVERELARQKTTIVARHIVVPTADLAAAILDSIKAGVPFENLAYRYSTDDYAPRGGYIVEV
ncbi:MAG: peptidylprolyl isomerase, partial [bacterium]